MIHEEKCAKYVLSNFTGDTREASFPQIISLGGNYHMPSRSIAVRAFWRKEQHDEKACAFPWWSQRDTSSAHALKRKDLSLTIQCGDKRPDVADFTDCLLDRNRGDSLATSMIFTVMRATAGTIQFNRAVASPRHTILAEDTTKCWSISTACRLC